jgi:hypothetical protein
MKLSQAQQRVVDFMKEHSSKLYVSRHFDHTTVFFQCDEWRGKRPSIATAHRLIDLGVIVRDDSEKTPYYREDYKLMEASE